jgi:hypothetical protein
VTPFRAGGEWLDAPALTTSRLGDEPGLEVLFVRLDEEAVSEVDGELDVEDLLEDDDLRGVEELCCRLPLRLG